MIKLQVKIILWILIISCTFLVSAATTERRRQRPRRWQIESINSNELALFEDFLRVQNLRHALVVGNAGPVTRSYSKLLGNYRVQYFNPMIMARSGRRRSRVNFQDLFYNDAPRTGILVKSFDSPSVRSHVLEAASVGRLFNNTQAWLLLSTANRTDHEECIVQQLGAYEINIDADITVAMRNQLDNDSSSSSFYSWLLYDVYKVSHRQQTPLLIEPKGQWTVENGYQLFKRFTTTTSWIRRRDDFGQAVLRTSTALLEKPAGLDDYGYLSNDKQWLQLDPMQRKTYQLLRLMEQMLNLRLDIRFKDNWGILLSNGSWTGVIGDLVADEADLSLCPLRFVTDRQKFIQFTPELHTQFIHFLFRHPRRSSIRNIFFEPLSERVWWCVLGLVVSSTVLLLFHVSHEQKSQQHRVESVEPRLGSIWFTMLETFLQQGPDTGLFHLPSTRLVIFASCIFSFMLMQFYGAFIVGSLLSDSPRTIISLQSLYASGLEVGMENIQYNYMLIANSTNPEVHQIYTERICRDPTHNIISISEGANRIQAGGFAFHTAIDRLYRLLMVRLTESEFCELQEIMFNPPYTSSSALPKSSPWREHLAHFILHMRATGLMQYNDLLWIVPKPDCRLSKASQVEVDLKHFAPALFTLAMAMVTSGLILMLELLVAKVTSSE